MGGLGLEEKVDVTTGVGYEAGLCVGNVGQVAGWPGLCLQVSLGGASLALGAVEDGSGTG